MRNKLFSISDACLSGLLLGVLASCGPNSGLTESHDSTGGNEGFDISFDANSHVYAKLESKTNGKNSSSSQALAKSKTLLTPPIVRMRKTTRKPATSDHYPPSIILPSARSSDRAAVISPP